MPVVAVLPFYRIGATPLALEIMRIFNAGSSVYASCYSDAGGTTPMGNSDAVPIQADGNGLFPVVFVPADAAYDIKFYYPPAGPPDLVGPERDTYEGIRPGGGGSGGEPDHYTVLVDSGDSTPGYLSEKVVNTTTVAWEIQEDGGYKRMAAKVDPAGVLDGKVKIDAGDANPGFLLDKLIEGHYIGITKTGNQIVIEFTGPNYVPKSGGKYDGTVEFAAGIISLLGSVLGGGTEIRDSLKAPDLPGTGDWLHIDVDGNVTRGAMPVVPADDHLVIADLVDLIPGPLGVKLKAGAGMAFNVTVDDTNGKVIHISSVDENPITAPLDEVISGDGAGGIKSSPLFKAVDGAVTAETFRANSTDVAIAAPNGSILVQDVASIDTSAWGGAGIAFFGLKGHNPPTNDGSIVGTMLGTYSMASYVHQGGSITLGVGSASQFGLYDSLATFLVPLFANAFNPTDCVNLTGAAYTSTFHAVIAFSGTGTTFAAPAGSSLNTSLRLSNSSAVGIAITGVATPFTLAAGASRDLFWSVGDITPKWY